MPFFLSGKGRIFILFNQSVGWIFCFAIEAKFKISVPEIKILNWLT